MSKEDEFKYYDKKLEEFDLFLKQAKSSTLIEIINQAKVKSNASLELLMKIQTVTISYLRQHNEKAINRIKTYNNAIELGAEKVDELKTLEIDEELRLTLRQFYSKSFSELEQRILFDNRVNNLTLETFTFCSKQFNDVLLSIIMKPSKSQFHYETIIEVLNYIATKLIPGLEELKTVSNFPISVRRKNFAKEGDKILLYLEQFIDVIDKWSELGQKYINIIEE